MFVNKQRIGPLNRLTNARVGLAAYMQLRRIKGYIPVSESNCLRDNFLEPNRELHDKLLWLNLRLDQEEWSALHHVGEALATAVVCLTSGCHDCPTVITVNANKLENCLMSLTLNIQSLQKHTMPGKA